MAPSLCSVALITVSIVNNSYEGVDLYICIVSLVFELSLPVVKKGGCNFRVETVDTGRVATKDDVSGSVSEVFAMAIDVDIAGSDVLDPESLTSVFVPGNFFFESEAGICASDSVNIDLVTELGLCVGTLLVLSSSMASVVGMEPFVIFMIISDELSDARVDDNE